MSDRETKTPAIPSLVGGSIEEVVRAITEVVEVREGRRGDPLDQALTMRDMIKLGFAAPSSNNTTTSGLPIFPTTPGVYPWDYDPTTDYTIPPTPVGFTVSGGYATIILTWDPPIYRNHAYVEVWRASSDSLGAATMIGHGLGAMYADAIGLEQTAYYWIRNVSQANVYSPYNGVAGTKGASALDVEKSLALIAAAIESSPTLTSLRSRIEGLESGTFTPSYINTVTNRVTGVAQDVRTLVSSNAGNTAALQQIMNVVNGLSASYSLKLEVGGHISGFSAAAYTNEAGTTTSEFIIAADRFAIAPPTVAAAVAPTVNLYPGFVWLNTSVTPNVTNYYTGSGWSTSQAYAKVPFTVLATAQVVNGVTRPPGIYMVDAYMGNGTIVNAMIGNLQVDNAKIVSLNVDKLLAGTLAVGQYIQSQGYVAGTTGWIISADGTAEFSGVIVRGGIYATYGQIGGINIGANQLYSSNWAYDGAGFYLASDGNAYFNQVRVRGQIAGGSFTDYAWPTNGGTGFYLGPSGLLLGNANLGKYFQVTNDGQVYAPQFSIINGNATFSGNLSAASGTFSGSLTAEVINTGNIIGGAIGVTQGTSLGGNWTVPVGWGAWGISHYMEVDSWARPIWIYMDLGFVNLIGNSMVDLVVNNTVVQSYYFNGGTQLWEGPGGGAVYNNPYSFIAKAVIFYPPGGVYNCYIRAFSQFNYGAYMKAGSSLMVVGTKK